MLELSLAIRHLVLNAVRNLAMVNLL
jgi:hypothetical protein